ncbi:MAG: ABC transporter permease [Firmicutes bacterium]|nr:ABC transporter permease [Bacillota bacterium]
MSESQAALEVSVLENQWALLVRRLVQHKTAMIGLVIITAMVLVALLAPAIASHDPLKQDISNRFARPSRDHYFGTDALGRDLYSRVVFGARLSLMLGVVAVGIAFSVGVLTGLLAGYYPRVDMVIMRLVDILMAFPAILLAIAIVGVLGPGVFNAIIAIGITSIPGFIRITRASVLSLRQTEYVEAARATGAADIRILYRHIFPNIMAPIIVFGTLHLSSAILSGAILSFLGLGAQPPTPEWGAMVSSSRQYLHLAPHMALFPILAIFLTVLGFNFLGDGLRDVLDPRLKN